MDARESARLIALLDKAAEGSRDGLSEVLHNALLRAKQEVAEHGRIRGRRTRREPIRLTSTGTFTTTGGSINVTNWSNREVAQNVRMTFR